MSDMGIFAYPPEWDESKGLEIRHAAKDGSAPGWSKFGQGADRTRRTQRYSCDTVNALRPAEVLVRAFRVASLTRKRSEVQFL
jgi:hypothetical protein